MKLVSLNLRHGGGKRVPHILEYIDRQAPDVFVGLEYRNGKSGGAIRDGLLEQGFRSFATGEAENHRTNSVLIASKLDGKPITFDPSAEDKQRIGGLRIGTLEIIGVYFANLKAKHSLFDYLLALPHPERETPCLLVGDFNTGSHHIDEPGTVFHCADKFDRLSDIGWVDLWRGQHGGDAREFSWYSHVGNGFRLDHAFSNSTAASCVISCDYDHSTRPGITDHSALIVATTL